LKENGNALKSFLIGLHWEIGTAKGEAEEFLTLQTTIGKEKLDHRGMKV
jgi:hypothetical protein